MLSPMIDDSASGVSSTRPGYFVAKPSVARNTPPASTSSPRTKTRSSFAISSSRVERTASITVIAVISRLLEDEAERVFGKRIGLRQRPLRTLADLLLDAPLDLVEILFREDPALFDARPEDLHGVLPRPLFELLLRAIAAVVIVAGM